MENTFWSKKVQSTEVLDTSRKEKFNENNRKLWFNLLHIRSNLKILEVGCGSGHFTNMIKRYFPSCQVYGVDLDANHIKFAQNECKKSNIDVNYQVADVKNLPFEDDSFDIVFSHTLVEHLPFDDFIKDQKRVLKSGGKLIIMRVDMVKKNDKPFMYLEDEINKVYSTFNFPQDVKVCGYLEDPDMTMQRLNQYNFKKIKFSYDRIIYYMPDVENKKVAISQIEKNYQTKLSYALFETERCNVDAETKENLVNLLKSQYEVRLRLLNSNKKIFDFQSSLLITISAEK